MKKLSKIGLFFILSFNSFINAQIPLQQRESLLSLFALNGNSWIDKTGWIGGVGTECQWFGITCDESEQNIIEIHLNNNNLSGELNTNINQLTHLKVLDLSDNSDSITTINIGVTRFNGLTGNIPNLNNLTALVELSLNSNQLTGPLPDFSKLPVLKKLKLGNNSGFTQLNERLSHLLALTFLDLNYGNKISSLTLTNLPKLTTLNLGGLQLESFTLIDLPVLTELYLRMNKLKILPDLTGFSTLKKLNLSFNNLTTLDNLPLSLIELKMEFNELEEIPDFSTLSNLRYLNLSENLFKMNKLENFSLFPNKLTTLKLEHSLLETIPNISYFKQLEFLSLQFNNLKVVEGLNELTSLTSLKLNNNSLQSFPPIFEFNGLKVLDLSDNDLSGVIPELTNLTHLEVLNLRRNKLTGQIPELNHLSNLNELNLSFNELTGTIPNLEKLDFLNKLSLEFNQLTGELPLLSTLPVFSHFNLSSNSLSGTLKRLEGININTDIINLSDNNLSGALTPLLAMKASGIYLSHNQFEGIITTELTDKFQLTIQRNKCLTPENNKVRSLLVGNKNISNWNTQDCSAPIAFLDNIHSFFNNNGIVIDVSTNDFQGGLVDKESVDLEPDFAGQQKIKVVERQGIWEVIGQKIKFTPLDNFHQDPFPIEYTIKHKTTNLISQNTPLNIDYPPIATDDALLNINAFGEARINIIENDITGDSINPSTIDLDLLQKGIQSTLVMDNEGFWQVNELGIITFTPVPNLNKNPHSISYTIQDHEGNISNLAAIKVSYKAFSTTLLNIVSNAFVNANKQLIIPAILVDHRYYSAVLEEIIHQGQSFWKLANLTQLNSGNQIISNYFNPSNFNLSLTLNTQDKIILNYQFFDKVSQTFYWKRADNINSFVEPVNLQENPHCLADNAQISWSEAIPSGFAGIIDILHIPAILSNQSHFSATLEKMDNLQEPNHPFWKLNLITTESFPKNHLKLLEQEFDTNCNQLDPNTLDIEFFRFFYKDINGSRVELNHQFLKFLFFDEKTSSFYWRG